MLAQILAEPAASYPNRTSMQLGVTGGTITQAQIEQTKARITPNLVNGLGATECHSIAVTPLNTSDDHRWHRPCEGVIQIVDDGDQPLSPGQIGRLRIDTVDAPQGYFGDEAATRIHFKQGFFYPGDLAVRREDGRIALMGRVTDVINVQGQKIAPAPIEDRLREALGVTDVCLVSLQDEAGEETLHAVIQTPAPIGSERLSTALNKEIRGFRAVRVHFVAAMPRNSAGKVLRRELVARLTAARTHQEKLASSPPPP